MSGDVNPYSAPASFESRGYPCFAQRFPGRSIIAFVFAVLLAFTALFTGGLWAINAIDLGRFGSVFLLSLFIASATLMIAATCYAKGARGLAVVLVVLSLGVMVCGIVLPLHDAGVFQHFEGMIENLALHCAM